MGSALAPKSIPIRDSMNEQIYRGVTTRAQDRPKIDPKRPQTGPDPPKTGLRQPKRHPRQTQTGVHPGSLRPMGAEHQHLGAILAYLKGPFGPSWSQPSKIAS